MPTSTMSDILKQSATLLANPPQGMTALKKKGRSAQFPVFEQLLASWIDKASNAKVVINDEIIKAQARLLIEELQDLENDIDENYTGFELSSGWLYGFKIQFGICRQRYAGDDGACDPAVVEPARERLQHTLKDKHPRDVYNCDETAFQ